MDLLFPRHCYSCGKAGNYLCPSCLPQLPTLPVVYPHTDSPLDGYLHLFRYRNSIRSLISDLKYQFSYDLVSELSSLINLKLRSDFPTLLKYWQDNRFYLLPIPLHWYRQNWRGFNQSQLIANSLSDLLNLPLSTVLTRSVYSRSQVSQKTKIGRLTNVNNVFSMDSHTDIVGQNFLLIDDVITTSATITQAANTLKSAHTSSVWALSIAG